MAEPAAAPLGFPWERNRAKGVILAMPQTAAVPLVFLGERSRAEGVVLTCPSRPPPAPVPVRTKPSLAIPLSWVSPHPFLNNPDPGICK